MTAKYTGVIWIGTEAERLAIATKYLDQGMQWYETDTDTTYTWDGVAWDTIATGSDHGVLTGLGDDDHTQYLLATGARAGSTGAQQDFGATGIKADVISEGTGAAGVIIDSCLIKDGTVLASDGLVGTPAYSFASDPDTGMYSMGANRLGFAIAGVQALEIDASQILWIGSTKDTTLYRSAANTLKTDDSFEVGGANLLIPGDVFINGWGKTAAATQLIGSNVVGDVNWRFLMYTTGLMVWGDGTNTDVTLYRENANLLKTDDEFWAVGPLDLTDGIAAPGGAAGRAKIYVDTADGDLKVVFADGFVATIAADS